MQLSTLRYFLVVAQELNITKAAEKLFITQQSLSEQISRLEKEYNAKLFERTPRLKLTPAGERMVIYAERLLNMERQCKNELSEMASFNRLSVGIRKAYCQAILPKVLPEFNWRYPNVRLHLTAATSRVMLPMLRQKKLDLCIGSPRLLIHPDFDTVFLAEDPYVVVIPENLLEQYFHLTGEEVRAGATPDFRALDSVPLLIMQDRQSITRVAVDNLLASYGILSGNVLLESHSIDTNLLVCSMGLGVTFVQQQIFRNYAINQNTQQPLYAFPFETPTVDLCTVISYPRSKPLSAAAQDFIELTKKAF